MKTSIIWLTWKSSGWVYYCVWLKLNLFSQGNEITIFLYSINILCSYSINLNKILLLFTRCKLLSYVIIICLFNLKLMKVFIVKEKLCGFLFLNSIVIQYCPCFIIFKLFLFYFVIQFSTVEFKWCDWLEMCRHIE